MKRLWLLPLLLMTPAALIAAEDGAVHRSYMVDVQAVSMVPDEGIKSFKGQHGRLTGSVGSTLGTGLGKDQPVELSFRPQLKDGKFLVEMTTRPEKDGDEKIEWIDLSDFSPKVINICEDEDGREYRIFITPSVDVIDLTPQPFAAVAKNLYRLQFDNVRIILNDRDYLGPMAASDATFFSIDICDLAAIEFSLYHLKDAQPWGTLKDGALTIAHPETGDYIVLNGVTNGRERVTVAGGPYQVWVRWKASEATSEQVRQQLETVKAKVLSGEINGASHALKLVEAMLAREPGPWAWSTAAREVSSSDIVEGAAKPTWATP